jgi:hypothetical protein
MDIDLEKALEFANYRSTLAGQTKSLKEKIDGKLTYGFNGGLFKIDQTLISFVQTVVDLQRTENVPILDSNMNPVIIEDLIVFRDEILDRYFSALLDYHEEYKKIKSSRTVEKLVDL